MVFFTIHLLRETNAQIYKLSDMTGVLSHPLCAQVHAESLQQVIKSQRDVTEVLQEATCKVAAQHTEAARLTTDAARQICEVRATENAFLWSSFHSSA